MTGNDYYTAAILFFAVVHECIRNKVSFITGKIVSFIKLSSGQVSIFTVQRFEMKIERDSFLRRYRPSYVVGKNNVKCKPRRSMLYLPMLSSSGLQSRPKRVPSKPQLTKSFVMMRASNFAVIMNSWVLLGCGMHTKLQLEFQNSYSFPAQKLLENPFSLPKVRTVLNWGFI